MRGGFNCFPRKNPQLYHNSSTERTYPDVFFTLHPWPEPVSFLFKVGKITNTSTNELCGLGMLFLFAVLSLVRCVCIDLGCNCKFKFGWKLSGFCF